MELTLIDVVGNYFAAAALLVLNGNGKTVPPVCEHTCWCA